MAGSLRMRAINGCPTSSARNYYGGGRSRAERDGRQKLRAKREEERKREGKRRGRDSGKERKKQKESATRTLERRFDEDANSVSLSLSLSFSLSGAKNSTFPNSSSFSGRYWHSSRVLVTCLVTVTKLHL